MSARPAATGPYARAIEQSLAHARGAPVLLSPRDFRYVTDWHARGVPLALILESIEAAAAPRRGASKGPRRLTLAYVAPSVEEAWGVVLGGRTVAPVDRGASGPSTVRQSWIDAARRAGEGSELARLVTRALREIDDGMDATAVDRVLDEGLARAAPADVLRSVEGRVDLDLKQFAARMTPAGLLATRRRAIADRLRGALALPRLADGRA